MKQKVSLSMGSMRGGLMIGITVSIALTLAGTAACAALISSETIAAGNDGYCAMVILLLATMGGTAAGAGKTKKKRLYVCMIIAGIYMLSLLAMTALFFDGQYVGISVTVLVIFAGSTAIAFAGKSSRKQPRLRKSRTKRR